MRIAFSYPIDESESYATDNHHGISSFSRINGARSKGGVFVEKLSGAKPATLRHGAEIKISPS